MKKVFLPVVICCMIILLLWQMIMLIEFSSTLRGHSSRLKEQSLLNSKQNDVLAIHTELLINLATERNVGIGDTTPMGPVQKKREL